MSKREGGKMDIVEITVRLFKNIMLTHQPIYAIHIT